MSKLAPIFAAMAFAATCLMLLVMSVAPIFPGGNSHEPFRGFSGTVNDRPIVSTLDGYYHLIHSGWAVIDVDGEQHRVFLQDYSLEERRILAGMLRTP